MRYYLGYTAAVMEFKSLSRFHGLRHTLSTREGGVSPAPFESLNLGFLTNDDPLNVSSNVRRLCETIDAPPDHIVTAQSSHLGNILIIEDSRYCRRAEALRESPTSFDALICCVPNIPLLLTSADCSLSIFYDTSKHLLAVVHAGWQGIALNIHRQTLQAMELKFGTQPQDVQVAVGPIVSAETYRISKARRRTLDALFPHGQLEDFAYFDEESTHLDLKALLSFQLADLGLKEIEFSPYSTDKSPELFYSARREGETGRFGLLTYLLD